MGKQIETNFVMRQIPTPVANTSGYLSFYPKTDDNFYLRNAAGVERRLATANDLGNYLPLTGGTITGILTIQNANLIQKPNLITRNNIGEFYEFLNVQGQVIGTRQISYWNGSAFVGTHGYGFGHLALSNNTGANSNGIGYAALRNNTGDYSNGIGHAALYYNTGVYSNGIGYSALRINTGDYSNGIGYYALFNNTGAYSNGIGYYALFNNTGANSNGIGYYTLCYNQGNLNNVIGHGSFSSFYNDDAKLKSFDSNNINTTTNQFTITAHGFGSNNSTVSLLYKGNAAGITNNRIYQIKIIDANTLQYDDNLTSQGSGNHSFTPQFTYEKVNILGANLNPERSNQTILGGLSVVAPQSTINEINIVGNKALITKEWFDTKIIDYLSGSGTANYLSKFAAAGVLANSVIYEEDGLVGIGTNSPAHELHVNGTIGASQIMVKSGSEILQLTGTYLEFGDSFNYNALFKVNTNSIEISGNNMNNWTAFPISIGSVGGGFGNGRYIKIDDTLDTFTVNFSKVKLPLANANAIVKTDADKNLMFFTDVISATKTMLTDCSFNSGTKELTFSRTSIVIEDGIVTELNSQADLVIQL